MPSTLNAQGAPVAGGFIQPAPGVTVAGVVPFRDTQPSVQAAAQVNAPGAGTAVATVTPGAAGLWEISGTVSISGTTVAAADSNNMQLRQNASVKMQNIPIAVNSTTGTPGSAPFGPVVLSLAAGDTVSINATAGATASSIYAAQIVAKPVSSPS